MTVSVRKVSLNYESGRFTYELEAPVERVIDRPKKM
jgi:hypothetical protein